MSDLAETFQNDISQIFNERGLLRTELIAKEKLLTDAILQKNTLNHSLKQMRIEKDELFVSNQKLKQEKLAAEAEKSASTIHVTILKEEKTLLEQKLYQITQQYEDLRLKIDELNRENFCLKNEKQHSYPISIQQTIDHRYEYDELKKRYDELERSHENILERHRNEIQLLKNEFNTKDDHIHHLQQLINQYEQQLDIYRRNEKDFQQRIENISQSQISNQLTLTDEELRTIENEPNSSSILSIYRSSKSLFDILVDYALLQKQNENLIHDKDKIDSQRRINENLLHQIQGEIQQQKIQNERLQFLADSRQIEYEQAIRDKQNLFKEKLELDRQYQQKLREYDDCLDDRNNMRAQIFHLLENGNIKGHLRSISLMPDNEILVRQGVVTFNSVEELYEQYMKCLADIRETDRFISELETTHAKEIEEITQRELILKDNLNQLRNKLDQTRTDINIQSLAKQVLVRDEQYHQSNIITYTTHIQTDLHIQDLNIIENNLQCLQKNLDEKDLDLQRMNDQMNLLQHKFDHVQKQNIDDKQKIDEFQRILDESLQRSNTLLSDIQLSELRYEQLKEQHEHLRNEYDQLMTTTTNLRTEIDKIQIEKQQINQLQEDVVNRIKQDIEIKRANQEDNLLNIRLQESVEELNSIMKDCVKQTELTNGTPAHITSLTKLEILYRQLQQRHQYDLEQHFAITESLKIKAKDAQNDLQKIQQQCEDMKIKFNDEQKISTAKIAELESKLRNADTTTVLTRLLPSATLENRLKEEEERTQQLRNWTNKLTEKIEHIQKQMANEKKDYEEKIEVMRQELRDTRNEYDAVEKHLEDAREIQQKSIREFTAKEEALEMDIFKLKTELDNSQMTNTSLKETIILKENDIRSLHDRLIDYENKMTNLEKEFFILKDKYARLTKEHNLPISEPPSPSINTVDLVNIDENLLDIAVESKTPGKRRRIVSASERTPMKLRAIRSQSMDCQSTINNDDETTEDNDDVMSTCSEPPSAKKRKRRGNDPTRLPAVDEEGDNENNTNSQETAAVTPTYNLRSRTKRLPKLQPNQTT